MQDCLCAARTLESAILNLTEYYERTRRIGRSRLAILASDARDATKLMGMSCGLDKSAASEIDGLIERAWEIRGQGRDEEQVRMVLEIRKAWREAACE